MIEKHLCVGGECDGEWHAPIVGHNPKELVVLVRKATVLVTDYNSSDHVKEAVQYAAYRRQDWYAGKDNPRYIWVPQDESENPEKSLDLLLRHYRPKVP